MGMLSNCLETCEILSGHLAVPMIFDEWSEEIVAQESARRSRGRATISKAVAKPMSDSLLFTNFLDHDLAIPNLRFGTAMNLHGEHATARNGRILFHVVDGLHPVQP